ncbi:MAG: hypothetical protein ACO3OK_03915, partial [Limisphaerales bacterium]
ARMELLAIRERRIRPGRDEKILAAWNGLMVRGMAIAARHLQRPELAESAARAIEFTRKHLWVDGRLFACWKDGRARFPAYLDDHAFMLNGILELLQQRWDYSDTRPRLKLGDQGLIEVVGGLRQLSFDDIPSPDQLSEVRERNLEQAQSSQEEESIDESRELEPSAVSPEKPLSDENQL